MRILFLVLCLGMSLVSYSQIHGTVVHASNQEPLAHVRVEIHETEATTLTDSKGYFVLPEVTPGTYHVHFYKDGFSPEELHVQVGLGDSIAALFISMKEIHFNMHEVVIEDRSGKWEEKRSAQSVHVFSKDEIQFQNGISLAERLSATPGIRAISTGVGMAKPQVRAYSGYRNAVFEYGIKHEAQQWGTDHGLEIDAAEVDRLEFIKGNANVLYGGDALGGVFIVPIPSLPANRWVVQTGSFYRSNNATVGEQVSVGFRASQFFTRMSFSNTVYEDSHLPAQSFTYLRRVYPIYNGVLQNTAGKQRHAAITIGRILPKGKIQFNQSVFVQEAGLFKGIVGIPTTYDVADDSDRSNINFPKVAVRHLKSVMNYAAQLGEYWMEINAGYQDNWRKELIRPLREGFNPLPNDSLAHSLHLRTWQANATWKRSKDNGGKRLEGIALERLDHRRGGYDFLLPNYSGNQTSVFIQSNSNGRANSALIITRGLRAEWVNWHSQAYDYPVYAAIDSIGYMMPRSINATRDFLGWSGNVGIRYERNKHIFRGNLSRAWRAPSAAELFINGIHHGTFRHEMGDVNLKAERGLMMDLEWSFKEENWSVTASPFVHHFQNYLFLRAMPQFSPLPAGGQLYAYTQDQVSISGMEVQGNYWFTDRNEIEVQGAALYTYVWSSGLATPFTAPMSAQVTWTREWLRIKKVHVIQSSITSSFNARQTRVDRNEKETPGSQVWNAQLSYRGMWRGCGVELFVGCYNILNHTVYNHTSNYRRLNLPEPGRNVQIQFNLKF